MIDNIENGSNERLKEVRKALDKTQMELAQILKISNRHLSDMEKGRKNITPSLMEMLKFKLGVNIKWLLNGNGEMFGFAEDKLSTYVSEITDGDDEFIKDLIEVYMELSPGSKKALHEVAYKMAEKAKNREQ